MQWSILSFIWVEKESKCWHRNKEFQNILNELQNKKKILFVVFVWNDAWRIDFYVGCANNELSICLKFIIFSGESFIWARFSKIESMTMT